MRKIKAFGMFWYDFIIGDDWKIACGVVIGLGLSALLAHTVSQSVWWVLPIVAVATLAVSLRLSIRRR